MHRRPPGDGTAKAVRSRLERRAARRLPDADREPRGRHAARARSSARGRHRRLRGHAAYPHAARPLRRDRRRWSATTSTTSASAPPSSCRGCARALSSPLSPTPACRSSPTPVSSSSQACIAAGLSVEVLPGPSSALAALVASGLPGRALALRRLSAAQEGRARAAAADEPPTRSSRSSRPSACQRRSRCSPPRIPSVRSPSAAS